MQESAILRLGGTIDVVDRDYLGDAAQPLPGLHRDSAEPLRHDVTQSSSREKALRLARTYMGASA